MGSAGIAGSAVPAQRDSISTRITAEQRHQVRRAGINGFKNHQSIQLQKKCIGHPGTRTEHNAFFEKSKKRNANPKACESSICSMPPRSSSRHARNPATQLHSENGVGRVSSCNPERLNRREERNIKNKYINLIQQESKNLFYFSPLLHVYSELHHSHGPLEFIPNTGAAKRTGSRQDIFDLCIFFQKKNIFFRNWYGRAAGPVGWPSGPRR